MTDKVINENKKVEEDIKVVEDIRKHGIKEVIKKHKEEKFRKQTHYTFSNAYNEVRKIFIRGYLLTGLFIFFGTNDPTSFEISATETIFDLVINMFLWLPATLARLVVERVLWY